MISKENENTINKIVVSIHSPFGKNKILLISREQIHTETAYYVNLLVVNTVY